MNTTEADGHSTALQSVKFSRLARRGLLLGLSVAQVACLAIGLLVVVVSLYGVGVSGLVWTAPVWCTTIAAAMVPVGGRKLIDWLPVAAHWGIRLTARQTSYRRRILKPRPAGALALPGDATAMRHYEDPETGAAMVHDPHAQNLANVLLCRLTRLAYPGRQVEGRQFDLFLRRHDLGGVHPMSTGCQPRRPHWPSPW